MAGFSRADVLRGARFILPEGYSQASDDQVESAFQGQLAMMENNAANIAQGIAGAVGSLGNLFGNLIGGDAGRTIGQVSGIASGLGNMGIDLYRQFSSPMMPMGTSPMMPMGTSPMMPMGTSPMMPMGTTTTPQPPYTRASPMTYPQVPSPYPMPAPTPSPGQPMMGNPLPANWTATAAGLMQNPMFLQAMGAAMLPAGARHVPLRPGGAQREGVPVEELLALASETFRRAAAQAAGVEEEAPLPGRLAALLEACDTFAQLIEAEPVGVSVMDCEGAFEEDDLDGSVEWFEDQFAR